MKYEYSMKIKSKGGSYCDEDTCVFLKIEL